MLKAIALPLILMVTSSLALALTGHFPYAGQDRREIKSLSQEQAARYGALRGYESKHGHDTGHRP